MATPVDSATLPELPGAGNAASQTLSTTPQQAGRHLPAAAAALFKGHAIDSAQHTAWRNS
jgi:hypothetical protein